GAAVAVAEVDAVRVEVERGLHVVVDHERHPALAAQPADRPAELDDLPGRHPLAAQLDDGCTALDRSLRGLEVGDDRVQPHREATPSTSTGPSPDPISVKPLATARDAASAAPRAAASSERPFASSAASVA